MIRADGSLSGYRWGARRKAELLVAVCSGVVVENLGTVGIEMIGSQRMFKFILCAEPFQVARTRSGPTNLA